MNLFDTRTVFLLCGIMGGMMSIILFSLKKSYPPTIKGLGDWAGGLFLMFLAGATTAGRGYFPDFLAISLANLFFFLGLYWTLYGTAQFLGRPSRPAPWLFFIIVLCGAHVWYTFGDSSLIARILLVNIGGIIVLGAQAYLVSRYQQDGFGKWLTFGTLVAGAGLQIMRLLVLLLVPHDLDIMAQSATNQFYTVGFAFSLLLYAIGTVLMSSEHLRAQFELLATRDSLTNAFTRRHWNTLCEGEFLRCKRSGRSLAVLALDLDHFKAVNDNHGHQAGDTVLTDFVARVNAHLRHSDHLGRFGGEEFLLLLPDTSLEQATQVAERIRSDLAKSTATPFCTVSIGVTTSDGRDPSVEAILARADAAMYRAKAAGRNRVETA